MNTAEIEQLRRQARHVLRPERIARVSALADMQTQRARGQQNLQAPDAVYVDGNTVRRKPSWGQWTTTTHATATRPSGSSREVITQDDFAKSRWVKGLAELPPHYIVSIRARYAPGRTERHEARDKLARMTAMHYRGDRCAAAYRLAWSVLEERTSRATLARLFGMSPDDWPNSSQRKVYNEVSARLSELDVDSLITWQGKVEQ